MVDESLAYALERKGDWQNLLGLISVWPEVPQKIWYLGSYYLLAKGDYISALQLFSRLVVLPDCPLEAYLRYGKALHGCNRVIEALDSYLKILARRHEVAPGWFDDALIAYGLACLELGLYQHWLQVMARFHLRAEGVGKCRYLAAQAYFCLGDWSRGWQLYQSRNEWFSPVRLVGALPAWREEMPLTSRKILLSSEMGIGDFIFFLRFVPRLRDRYDAICVAVPECLMQLASASGFFDFVYDIADDISDLFDWHLPIASLPYFLRPFEIKPGEECVFKPYLSLKSSPPSGFDMLSHAGRMRPLVALNWRGNQSSESPSLTVRGRSVPLVFLERVASFCEVDLVWVQVGADDEKLFSPLMKYLHPFQECLDKSQWDICDIGWVLAKCDLLITNDTSLAHLGGALGLPTWVMLKQFPSWQWGVSGDCQWYSSVRCFRQEQDFDWVSVIRKVDKALFRYVLNWKKG
ncbi:hypothetical protein [Synechococcus sp. BS55D]|uniref:hypothetical protein n=1 Tax=Synechococcus sp. BS55D TaxID=2055943 RepID=UPI00103ABDB1|nr:hypothetical protein [Synechococcus sp. BS55D]